MTDEQITGQLSIFDQDTWSGKTSPEPSPATKGKTSKPFSRKSSKSQAPKRPTFLYLIGGADGTKPEGYSDIAPTGSRFPSAGEYTTRSFGEFPSEENASRLSQILEDSPLPKYSLSAKACEGILRRAERRGKELPEALRIALEAQSHFKREPESQGGGKGILIQNEHTGALSTFNNQSVFCIEGHVVDRNTSQNGIGVREGSSHTLNVTDRHAVVQVYDARGNGDGVQAPTITGDHNNRPDGSTSAIKARDYKDGTDLVFGIDRAAFNQGKNALYDFAISEDQSSTLISRGPNAVMNSNVRRLTPLECERLQGFPDNWTDLGEWTDTKGKLHKPSDSPRYKALGNSIALPFWFWLLRRISAQYERPATMASLFDGIGGFSLCWEKCNGKGSALWASEIEEFPIAVTKRRFSE